jgi:uncharacterized RmlC-like cupin family protein
MQLLRGCRVKVWRDGYGGIDKGKSWTRGASGGELPGQAGTKLYPRDQRRDCGSQAIWLGSATLPARGGRTKAHLHENHETALYLLSGEAVELWTGEQLEHRDIVHPGNYVYIPAGVPHVAVNRSKTPAVFLAARTDPNEQESVVLRPDLEEKVP